MVKRFVDEWNRWRLIRQRFTHCLDYPLISPKGLHLPVTQLPNPVTYKTPVLTLNVFRHVA